MHEQRTLPLDVLTYERIKELSGKLGVSMVGLVRLLVNALDVEEEGGEVVVLAKPLALGPDGRPLKFRRIRVVTVSSFKEYVRDLCGTDAEELRKRVSVLEAEVKLLRKYLAVERRARALAEKRVEELRRRVAELEREAGCGGLKEELEACRDRLAKVIMRAAGKVYGTLPGCAGIVKELMDHCVLGEAKEWLATGKLQPHIHGDDAYAWILECREQIMKAEQEGECKPKHFKLY